MTSLNECFQAGKVLDRDVMIDLTCGGWNIRRGGSSLFIFLIILVFL